jgi:uncharacterized protein YnzC (UPF0291/DUF896 family)
MSPMARRQAPGTVHVATKPSWGSAFPGLGFAAIWAYRSAIPHSAEKSMGKLKRKLTPAEKAEKKRRRKEYMIIFMNGKQKRVKRPPAIDGMDVDEFIQRNADPIWLHQNEMWENMT